MPLTVETEPLADQSPNENFLNEAAAAIAESDGDATDVETQVVDESTTEPTADGADATPDVDYDDQPVGESGGESASVDESPAPPPPAPKPVDDAAHMLARIAAAEAEVREAESRIAEIKGELKDAKEDYEAAINRLCRLSRQSSNDANRPLLFCGPPPAAATEPTPRDGGDATPQPPESIESASPLASAGDPPDWRSVRLDDPNYFPSLAGQKGTLAKLAEAGIETVGQMVAFQSSQNGGGKDITDIKGIGSGKAEKISDAMECFWRDNPEMNLDEAVDES